MSDTIYLGKGKIISPKSGQNFKPFFSGFLYKDEIEKIVDEKFINFNISTLKEPDKNGNTHTIIYKEPYTKDEQKETQKDDSPF